MQVYRLIPPLVTLLVAARVFAFAMNRDDMWGPIGYVVSFALLVGAIGIGVWLWRSRGERVGPYRYYED